MLVNNLDEWPDDYNWRETFGFGKMRFNPVTGEELKEYKKVKDSIKSLANVLGTNTKGLLAELWHDELDEEFLDEVAGEILEKQRKG